MTELKLLVSSVKILFDAYITYGNCIHSNKRYSVRIKKRAIYKEPAASEVWGFTCNPSNVVINYRPRYSSTEGRMILAAFDEIEGELNLYEKALQHLELPVLTKKFFLNHHEFRGIGCGTARIEKAIEKAGSARQFLTELKNENLPALVDAFDSQIRGIAFLTAYQNVKSEFDSIEFIQKLGYDRRTAHRLIRLFGHSTKSVLRDNPYSPIRLGSRFNNAWGVAENIRKLEKEEINKIAEDSPKRLIGAIDFIVYRALLNNHTAIPEAQFKSSLSSLIGGNLVEKAIDTGLSMVTLCRTSFGDYQGAGLANLEGMVERSLVKKLLEVNTVPLNGLIQGHIKEFSNYSYQKNGFHLTEEQKQLAFNALTKNLSVAQGEGGTGKSTALACVKFVCNKQQRPTYFITVAGIAKKRINDELRKMQVIRKTNTNLFGDGDDEICCYTVRGFIRQIKLTLDKAKVKNAILLDENPLIVFDESSMIDLPLLVEFLSLMDQHAFNYSISMVGDIAQIAPVGFGVVWQHLVNLGAQNPNAIPYSELSSVHRQEVGNPIRAVATLVRAVGHSSKNDWCDKTCRFSIDPLTELTELSSFSGQAGVYYLHACDAQVLSNTYSLVKKLGLDLSQVITPYSNADNPLSTSSINSYFIANEQNSALNKSLWGFTKGDRVIVTKNHSVLDLYNGDMATVTDIVYDQAVAGEDIQKKLVCKFPEETVTIDESACFDTGLVHSYGITIHKTQGSEFPYTIVILPRSASASFVENSMIYTALTRSQIATIFIGDMGTLKNAINSKPSYKRICSGFNLDAELKNQLS